MSWSSLENQYRHSNWWNRWCQRKTNENEKKRRRRRWSETATNIKPDRNREYPMAFCTMKTMKTTVERYYGRKTHVYGFCHSMEDGIDTKPGNNDNCTFECIQKRTIAHRLSFGWRQIIQLKLYTNIQYARQQQSIAYSIIFDLQRQLSTGGHWIWYLIE